ETVRLQWAAFHSWGLVVRGGPSAQIRFAGLAPDEEAQIRDWLKSGASAPAAAPPAAAPARDPALEAARAAARAAVQAAPTPPGGSAPVPAGGPGAPGGRAAPAMGPPPGFADRKPIRPQTQTRPPARVVPPTMSTSPGTPAPPAAAPGASAAAPAALADGKPAATAALSGLFDEGAVAAAGPGTIPAGEAAAQVP